MLTLQVARGLVSIIESGSQNLRMRKQTRQNAEVVVGFVGSQAASSKIYHRFWRLFSFVMAENSEAVSSKKPGRDIL